YLYGMGPLEYLSGEITIFDGKAYKSTVLTDSTMIVEETFAVKAPFFGYGRVKKWKQIKLPSEINSMSSLENYLEKNTKSSKRPFFFKLHGEITYAKIHIMNLPKGTEVTSPDIAHNTQVDYHIENVDSDIIGFFSTDHKTIFTHHDTYLHMHLITKDRQKMGHIDDLIINPKKVLLFVPK
ncbi:MAG TPA: acetolactate decarboxylase, partial [Saprospiraceae bacterium]|nr:acetolactate decarboxylase [Saprospiraceae bacterium]